MIQKYKIVSIVYGGSGKTYASQLHDRITDLAERERYPILSRIIMERVLTRELLSDVMDLFRKSQFCVAFLTADDFFQAEGKTRLRQNVVFELGMALIQMGRERCILLSDFDVRNPDFTLPSDMNSLEIRQFRREEFPQVMEDVIGKLLELSRSSLDSRETAPTIPQYNQLFRRDTYYIDYENIFPLSGTRAEGSSFLRETLQGWLEECRGLPHYDEKAIYLFERIGFLPIFGRIPEAQQWLERSSELLENYTEADIRYYGHTQILDFVRNLCCNIIEYTRIKTAAESPDYRLYRRLLEDFLLDDFPAEPHLNPLIAVVYYDYLGLTYMRLYRGEGKEPDILAAQQAFETALSYVGRVDMSLRIWSGFLTYNLARAYSDQGRIEEAQRHYRRAIQIRERWLRASKYNVTVRNALASEYFIAKIDYTAMCRKNALLQEAQVEREYDNIEIELNTYCDVDDRLEQLLYVRRLLNQRRTEG